MRKFELSVRVGLLATAAIVLGAASSAPGQEWAKKMFDHTTKDLGVVARGAKVEHTFMVENIYLEDAHIASIRSSCGCTNPQVEKPYLKTYDKTPLVAVVDTKNYDGRKDVTLTVKFDRPFEAEVQLNLYVTIRTDVVFQPGSVQFGTVPVGTAVDRTVSVVFSGRPNWQIVRVDSTNPNIVAQPKEVSRVADPQFAGATKVTYDLAVRLSREAPAGRLRDQLLLITNDPNPQNAQVPLAVEGTVVAPLTANPSPLSMGAVVAGTTVTRPLVLTARTPFKVVRATCSDPRFAVETPAEPKAAQVVPVKFTAPAGPGKVSGVIRIETDLAEGGVVEVKADAMVVAPSKP